MGSSFGQRIKARGHSVRVLCRTPESLNKFPWADETALWEKILPADTDVILMSVAPRDGANYSETYLANAKAIQSAPYILYTSSTAVYGDYQGQLVDEDTFLKPAWRNCHLSF